jgi:hypothetical protein
VETVQRAMIPSYVESSLRGSAYGIYYLTVGTSFLCANTMVGTLWETHGTGYSSIYSIVLALAAIIGLVIMEQR